jgi:hypothetical protein
MSQEPASRLVHAAVPVAVRLSGLWVATMFCYVYGDIIGLWVPGRIAATASGDLGPLGTATPAILVGIALFMALPALMVALSLYLPARANRIANIACGIAYTLAMMASLLGGAQPYYIALAGLEIALTLAITVQALRWPTCRS